MRRTRQVIAVMMVATALCADRAVVAAPQAGVVEAGNAAGGARGISGFVSRLTSNLQRAIPAPAVQPVRAQEHVQLQPLAIRQAASGVRSDYAPFQFRLPPPAL